MVSHGGACDRKPYAKLHAAEAVVVEGFEDRAHAAVSAVAAFDPRAHAADAEVDLVVHQDALRGNESECVAHPAQQRPRVVDRAERLDQVERNAIVVDLREHGVRSRGPGCAQALREPVDGRLPDVVPRALVVRPGIAEADHRKRPVGRRQRVASAAGPSVRANAAPVARAGPEPCPLSTTEIARPDESGEVGVRRGQRGECLQRGIMRIASRPQNLPSVRPDEDCVIDHLERPFRDRDVRRPMARGVIGKRSDDEDLARCRSTSPGSRARPGSSTASAFASSRTNVTPFAAAFGTHAGLDRRDRGKRLRSARQRHAGRQRGRDRGQRGRHPVLAEELRLHGHRPAFVDDREREPIGPARADVHRTNHRFRRKAVGDHAAPARAPRMPDTRGSSTFSTAVPSAGNAAISLAFSCAIASFEPYALA